MRRLLASLLLSVGVGLLVGGVCAFAFALRMKPEETVRARHFGPLNGVWADTENAFLGAVLFSVGCGLTAFGLTWFLVRARPWSSLLLGLLAFLVSGGLSGWGAHRLTGRLPFLMSLAEADQAEQGLSDYLDSPERNRITADFKRRLEAQDERTEYGGRWTWSCRPVSRDEILVTGTVQAREKYTYRNTPQGDRKRIVTEHFRNLNVTLRVKKQDGAWLVDDVEYKD